MFSFPSLHQKTVSTIRFCLALCLGFSISRLPAQQPTTATQTDAPQKEAAFLTNIRPLTIEGKRAGEGYFSADGKKMVFQSEREPGNPFYQIYELDLETGDTTRISPGFGNTTCSFINPATGDILFASTHGDAAEAKKHMDAELKMRAERKERRYAWAYEKEMEIWVHDANTGKLTNLTNSPGYDAEGSYSPDGKTIVFCSLRSGYTGKLSPDDEKRLKIDPSYFGEIYTMNADGSNVKQITHTPGYDGGPFFSRDGKKIIWRRFTTDGMKADVWTANADGSEAKQITDFGAMSWAPYFDATDNYIIFTSNKLGFDNFELFIVDNEGKKEPVRVTFTHGFDGLPVPSPDGKKLAWTTNRDGHGAQIYMADWNDAAARKAVADAPPRIENSKLHQNETPSKPKEPAK